MQGWNRLNIEVANRPFELQKGSPFVGQWMQDELRCRHWMMGSRDFRHEIFVKIGSRSKNDGLCPNVTL